jgi:predicted lipoprotein with Yx(FWY)xxD motif
MTRSKSVLFLGGAAVPLTALAMAAVGGGTDASASVVLPTATRQVASVSAASPTVHVRSTHLGKVLVDSRGRTLYVFMKDKGTTSTCFGACASAWPPLRAAGKPTVAGGAHASMVGTTRRSDGRPQVIYNRHPLYRFQGDKKPGDTNGQGLTAFGGRWSVISPSGRRVTRAAAGSRSTTY